jgi:hypothetical protein
MCCFGKDLGISNDCNSNIDSFGSLGYSFETPKNLKKDTNEFYSYLAGSFKFKVVDLEVFKVCIS